MVAAGLQKRSKEAVFGHVGPPRRKIETPFGDLSHSLLKASLKGSSVLKSMHILAEPLDVGVGRLVLQPFTSGGITDMMGIKERNFQPLLDDLSLEVLVPKDNFYRRLEERIDLSFVRELVLPLYANGGRHSIDPVVFFKLQLVLFFENLRSERQLMEVVADRLSLRWYVGYDLHELLPDHSSLTKIRERYGLEVFRNFFARIVEMCVEAGIVGGKELFFDATKVEADAAVDSLAPRWFVEAHLSDLFKEDDVRHQNDSEDPQDVEEAEVEDEGVVRSLPTAEDEDLLRSNSAGKDWISRVGKQDRSFSSDPRKRTSDSRASRTDPDATPMYEMVWQRP